jgi:uncharacterized protein (DUF1330 family)
MTVYVIADIKVTDDKWVPAYAAAVHDIVHKHGGKYLARSGNVKTLEGKPLDTTLIALLQFPSAEAVQAFATDPDYARYAAARQAGSESRLQLIDDTDLAGTIPYLPKGFITEPSSAGLPPSVVAHHMDIQLMRSHLVERGLGGMSVRARRSIITA